MPIPERFIDELTARTDLVDLVSEYVRLSKKGRNYWGLCPFHSEKTPSFSVSADKQIFKCFGCGKGGGAINFMMEMDSLPFVDAVKVLAKRVNMEVPETGYSPGMRERREKLLELNKQAARVFHRWLYEAEGAEGLDYLRSRGLSKATLTNFGLGFAPGRWDGLIQAMAGQGCDKRDLLDAGLAVSGKDGRIYDRFRNRVMFPIIDLRGEVIGFGGRVMDDSTPKYLNSPDTPVYNKSRNVFALNIAKRSKAGRVILTEGYMDTISLHQAGFDSAVASLGTSLTAEHAQLLSRYFQSAVIAYDGDGAGVSAAQRAIPLLEKAGLNVKVLRIRGAKDPDEFIKKYGREAFSKLLDESENHIDYRLEQIRRKYDLSDDAQKVEFLRESTGLLASLHSAVEREIYGGHAAQMAGVTPESIAQEVKKELSRRLRKEKQQQERRELAPAANLQPQHRELRYADVRSARAEEGVLRLILLDPGLLGEMNGLTEEEFSSPLLGKVFTLLRRRAAEGLSVQLPALAGSLEPAEMDHLTYVAGQPESLANSRQALKDYIAVIRGQALRRQGADGDELLRAAQKKNLEKKAYMEERP
ncbi:MAG: DNA primase [Lawsonibacter sp.]|nr:DNA primase [Lawsonibacter sp.]